MKSRKDIDVFEPVLETKSTAFKLCLIISLVELVGFELKQEFKRAVALFYLFPPFPEGEGDTGGEGLT
jgi:hypothetical protein